MFRNMSLFFQYTNILRSRGETVFTVGYQDDNQFRVGIPSLGRVTYPHHDYSIIKDMKAYLKLMEIPFNDTIPENIGLVVLGSVEEMVMKEYGVLFDKADRFAFKKKFENELFHRVDKNYFIKSYDDDEYVIFTKLPDINNLRIDR